MSLENKLFDIKDHSNLVTSDSAMISTIFIQIKNKLDLWEAENRISSFDVIKLFQDNILSIFKKHHINNINVQNNKIYGCLELSSINSNQAKDIWETAVDVNGFMQTFLKPNHNIDYKIIITLETDSVIYIKPDSSNSFSWITINNAMNSINNIIMYSKKENCILLDHNFVVNNKEILWNDNIKYNYYEIDSGNNYYSTWLNKEWNK